MQTEKSKPESKRIMPETDFIASFRHYLLTQVLGFSGLHRRPITDKFSCLLLENRVLLYKIAIISFYLLQLTLYDPNVLRSFSLGRVSGVCKELASFLYLVGAVPAYVKNRIFLLKIEQTPCHSIPHRR